MFKMVMTLSSWIFALAPSGKQVGKAAKVIARESAQLAASNPDFWNSIPFWAWILAGMLIIIGIIYWILN